MRRDDVDPEELARRERLATGALDRDRRMVERHLKRAVEEAVELGMDLDALREMFEDEIAMEVAARQGSDPSSDGGDAA